MAGNANQQWVRQGKRWVWAQHNKCLHVDGSKGVAGTVVHLWTCDLQRGQEWTAGGTGVCQAPTKGLRPRIPAGPAGGLVQLEREGYEVPAPWGDAYVTDSQVAYCDSDHLGAVDFTVTSHGYAVPTGKVRVSVRTRAPRSPGGCPRAQPRKRGRAARPSRAKWSPFASRQASRPFSWRPRTALAT